MKILRWWGWTLTIYLGDEAFVSNVQKRIGKEKDDLNIPRKQKRPIAKPLAQIAGQADGRNAAIIAAYATGAYSQREIEKARESVKSMH